MTPPLQMLELRGYKASKRHNKISFTDLLSSVTYQLLRDRAPWPR